MKSSCALIVSCAGLSLCLSVPFISEARAQAIAINEFRNGAPDAIELLVIEDRLDARGMVLKDYGSDGTNDSGGAFVFADIATWAELRAGTLLTFFLDDRGPDTAVGGDAYRINAGLRDTGSFVSTGGVFNLATHEIVQLKAAGSDAKGGVGAIHTFASGRAGTSPLFLAAPGARLRTSAAGQDTGQNESAEATTPLARAGDYDGTNATGNGTGTLGAWNTPANRDFILTLRGLPVPTDLRFSRSAATVGEGAGVYTVTVHRTRADGRVSARIAVSGTARIGAGGDATLSTTNIVFEGGAMQATLEIAVNDDILTESPETIVLALTDVVGAQAADPDRFTLTIADNDAPLDVWINEIHYDNVGADANEGVEIAGKAGRRLDVYSLYTYNGADGTVKRTLPLTGRVDDEGQGFGAVWFAFPTNGLENDMEGIALVRESGGETNVLQFLSYEGSFTGAEGPAQGVPSTDIGVREGETTPAWFSLQLTGRGYGYSDFSWIGPIEHSRGSLNAGQSFIRDGGTLYFR